MDRSAQTTHPPAQKADLVTLADNLLKKVMGRSDLLVSTAIRHGYPQADAEGRLLGEHQVSGYAEPALFAAVAWMVGDGWSEEQLGEMAEEIAEAQDDECEEEDLHARDCLCPTCRHSDRAGFADPGGRSALRAATANNPRVHPCPTCGEPNTLTGRDLDLGYQCDGCADAAEGG